MFLPSFPFFFQSKKETSAQETTVAPTEANSIYPESNGRGGMSRIFEAMGVHMVAPADGENKQFFIINGEVAEISFSENEFLIVIKSFQHC